MSTLASGCRYSAALGLLLAAVSASAQEGWKPTEREEPYAVRGATAPELYESIGANGPKAGIGRAIAFTDFKLTWRRDYRRRGDACVLVSAEPKLVITYRLPKPAGRLSGDVARRWDVFIRGVRAHEKGHGAMIVELTRAIETATVGLSVPDDPGCARIKAVMTKRLAALSAEQRRRSRDFDRREMSEGGNVHRLILAFVNG